MTDEKLIDPDCRDGKCHACVGGLCQCSCHWADHIGVVFRDLEDVPVRAGLL